VKPLNERYISFTGTAVMIRLDQILFVMEGEDAVHTQIFISEKSGFVSPYPYSETIQYIATAFQAEDATITHIDLGEVTFTQ
jgi:hypothetical protein